MDDRYLEFKKLVNDLKQSDKKPTLLLHSCCGPCSSHVLMMLKDSFDITILYYNPNIYPDEEFDKRVIYQQKIIDCVDKNIKLKVEKADHELFHDAVATYTNLPEGSMRCYKCYEFRLKHLADVADRDHFDYYTSVMSVSPYKNSDWINELLDKYQGDYSKPLYSNFKKDNGYQNTIKYSKEYGLYRQDWCGCEYSIAEHEDRINTKK